MRDSTQTKQSIVNPFLLDKMAAISQKIYTDAFLLMKIVYFD